MSIYRKLRSWLYRNYWFNLVVKVGRWGKRVARRQLLSRAERQRGLVSLSTLVNHRFGNQLFQYLFLRSYAEQRGLRYEATGWAGEALFGKKLRRLTRKLPEFKVKAEQETFSEEPVNVDFRGYFQFHTSYYRPFRDQARAWFHPQGQYRELAEEALVRLRERGKTLVGLHVRRGDFGYAYFYITPNGWYRVWLDSFWETLNEPVLFVASDYSRRAIEDLSAYNPVMAGDLGIEFPSKFQYYLDFYLLTQMDHLGIANSTFSFFAAMLNARAHSFVRPVLCQQKVVPFDPWDALPMLRDDLVDDFPDVEGITWDDYDYPGTPAVLPLKTRQARGLA